MNRQTARALPRGLGKTPVELGERDGNGDGNDDNRPPTPAHPEHHPTRPDIG
jgi:hypothetical protein